MTVDKRAFTETSRLMREISECNEKIQKMRYELNHEATLGDVINKEQKENEIAELMMTKNRLRTELSDLNTAQTKSRR